MARLVISNNSAQNPLSWDLTPFLDTQADAGMDPADPEFTQRIWTRSLLKEGATLSLEQLTEKELLFPLYLGPKSGTGITPTALVNLVPNGSVEHDVVGQAPVGWAQFGTGSAFQVQNGWAQSGSQSLRYTMTSVTGNEFPGVDTGIGLAAIPVIGGTTYEALITVNILTNTAAGTTTGVRVRWWDNTGAQLSDSTIGLGGNLPTAAGVYAYSGAVTAPANAAYGSILVLAHFSAIGQELDMYVDAALLGSASSYFDGDFGLGYQWSGSPGNSASYYSPESAVLQLIAQINAIIETPGATVTWQPTGALNPTRFDLLSGQLDPDYNYWREQGGWTHCKLRLFTQPLGHSASPRPYAVASGVGPLLMISPYASSGALAIGPSTQGGVTGFGGQQQGASSGVFYPGSPSLAGDAPALLQISYVGPLAPGATTPGTVPNVAVSLLPDPLYRPLISAAELAAGGGLGTIAEATAPGGAYVPMGNAIAGVRTPQVAFAPLPVASYSLQDPTLRWSGLHRLLAIARCASVTTGSAVTLQTLGNQLVPNPTIASVASFDWALYDLGTFSIRPSEPPQQFVQIAGGGFHQRVDLGAVIMLPDNATWFLNPVAIQASQYGYPFSTFAPIPPPTVASAPYNNTFILDGVISDQFIYSGQSQTFAPSPLGAVPSSARITQFSRGLVPKPDPKNGLPIIAIVGVGQLGASSSNGTGASWANVQNLRTMAQVNVLERYRYVAP